MAEKFLQSRLYEYGANSNLVLESSRDSRRRATDEPKGEVESLRGTVHKIKMGDRLKDRQNESNLQDSELQAAKRQKVSISVNDSTSSSHKNKKAHHPIIGGSSGNGNDILASADEMNIYHYIPKSVESIQAYEELLLYTQSLIGDQPSEVLKSAANEILSILKDGVHDNSFKQKEISKLLATQITNFGDLLRINNRISDYKDPNVKGNRRGDEDEDEDDENRGIIEEMAVVFDDEEEGRMGEDDEDEVDDDEEENNTATNVTKLKGAKLNDNEEEEIMKNARNSDKYSDLSIHDIDAYWLQRQLSKYYPDGNISSKLAEETLALLNPTMDERTCENKLVFLLDFDKFDLIKKLLKYRNKIFYCIKLKSTQNDLEKNKIENEMENDYEYGGKEILRLLKEKSSAESWTSDRMGEMALKARKEAMSLTSGGGGGSSSGLLGSGNEEEMMISSSGNGASVGVGGGGGSAAIPSFEKNINLSDLIFHEGNHLMTNTRCELPEKSWRAQKKGYEEVHIPALKPVLAAEDTLKQVHSLPTWMHDVFKGVKHFNRVQSKMADTALNNTDDNLLLCAPTGSGKTIVALLCMLGLISKYYSPETNKINLAEFKIVYIAPMKALVQECVQNFGKKLECFGMNVKELSGDQSLSQAQINETHVIVTTPEKWDIVTRKAGGDRTYTKLVKLMIIDEIHLLHDDRGPVLESIVARVQRFVESGQNTVRIVGLSATLPNYEDVAAFLRVKPDKGLFFFDNSYRPVPLQQQFIGITERKAVKRMQLMNEICYEKVLLHAGKNQILIFTHSRADTAKTARALVELATTNDTLGRFVQEGSASYEILKSETENAKSPDLKELLKYGFAIHHAGLVRSDRTLVEDLFADKHVQVLVSTATLAWGVNLPCHTVIIKGTQMYLPEKGGWTELSPLDILQMMGRAGRYGLDSEGEGIILTNHSELQYYLSLMNQQLPIESQLVKKLPECLNSEVVLGTVNNIMEAASWIGYTFLFIRMLQRPSLYGINADDYDVSADPTLLKRRLELAYAAVSLLEKHDLVKFDRKSGNIQSTDLGRIASYYYISNESIATYTDGMRPTMSEIDIIRLFSLSSEFKFMRVREEEKLELSKLLARVPIPIKEGVEEPSAKVNVLLQSFISKHKLDGFAIASDMIFIQQSAGRLLRALYEIALRKGWGIVSLKILDICIMIERRLWRSQSPLRQFNAIPELLLRKLEKISDITWDKYLVLKSQDFGEMVKLPKMGKTLYKFVHMIPRLVVDVNAYPISRSSLHIEAKLKSDFEYNESFHGYQILFWLRIEDGNGEKILHYEPILVQSSHFKKSSSSSTNNKGNENGSIWEYTTRFIIPLLDPLPPQYFLRVIADRWLHSQTIIPITFHHLTLPNKFHPYTELLDLSLYPINSFRSKEIEEFFLPIDILNSLQTQTYFALYENSENVMISSPSGSGKTICIELAIMRHFIKSNKEDNEEENGKILYITPMMETAKLVYRSWKKKMNEIFNKEVTILTGDLNHDQTLVKTSDVIIATPEIWSNISRKWKTKKYLLSFSLYLFDDLHFIGSSSGSSSSSSSSSSSGSGSGSHHKGCIYETVIARCRFISSQLEVPSRFIGFSHSLPNTLDLGNWLGITSSNMIFNFPSDCHPGNSPPSINIVGIDNYELHQRLQSMSKPVYDTIVKHSHHNLSFIFVPSRKQAQITSIDLIGYSSSISGKKTKYRFSTYYPSSSTTMNENEIINESFYSHFNDQDSLLGNIMQEGIAYIHEGMNEKDLLLMSSLCEKGIINVLLIPYSMVYSIALSASLVIIMDNQIFNGLSNQYMDLPAHYLWKMIGKCDNHSDYHNQSMIQVYCSIYKKEQIRRLIFESLPLESYLTSYLKDMLNEEIVNGTIETLTDAVDYLTWTFYYHRLTQNPNFYSLTGTTVRHISDHLSELVETATTELTENKLISLEDEINVIPLNLGMIASFYGISSLSIDMMSTTITEKVKLRGIFDIITTCEEFSSLLIRFNELSLLKKLSYELSSLPISRVSPILLIKEDDFHNNLIKYKISLLLYVYLLRIPITSYELIYDLKSILLSSMNLLHALIDIIASQGWLKSALTTMEACQYLIQGIWENDNLLLQIPHFSKDFIENIIKIHFPSIESIFDIIDLNDNDRENLLIKYGKFNKKQLAEIAYFCNSYPYIELSYQLSFKKENEENNEVKAGELITVNVQLMRDVDDEEEEDEEGEGKEEKKIGLVSSLRYPNEKYENWWTLIGDVKGNNLYAIKKLTILKKATVSYFCFFIRLCLTILFLFFFAFLHYFSLL
jgi:pre-mRNA-splicing helicase BRR2